MKELQSLGRWWLDELAHVSADLRSRLPQKVTNDLKAVYQTQATSAPDSSTGLSFVSDDASSWAALAGTAREPDGRMRPLSLLIPETLCLVRSSTYPDVPAAELKTIIGLELAATTPFTAANAAWTFQRRENGATDVIIVKRELIDRICKEAETAGLVLKDIRLAPSSDPGNGTGSGTASSKIPAFEAYETPEKRRIRLWHKINLGLAASLAVLAVATYGVSYVQKSAALDTLKSEIAAKTAEARSLRSALTEKEQAAEAAQQLQALKNDRSSVIETWARITQLLPKTAWVSELMLTREGGTIVGFTGSAASLIALLEQDPALKDVTFATAIRIDPLSKAERFDIRFAHEAADQPGASGGNGQ